MNLKIGKCVDCLFRRTEIGGFEESLYSSCGLLANEAFQNECDLQVSPGNYFPIHFYKNGRVKSKNKEVLDNCPLLIEKIEIEYGK